MSGEAFLHWLRVSCNLEGGETQTTEAERALISSFARQASRALEIGVFEGVTTCVIAENLPPEGRLLAIDPFFAGRLGICYGKWIAKALLRKRGVLDKVDFLEMVSGQAAQALDGSFDFVFLDGDHSLAAIAEDWNDWAPRVNQGGIIALHDTSVPAHDPSVAGLGSYQYYQKHIRHDRRFERVAGVDSLNVLRRLPFG